MMCQYCPWETVNVSAMKDHLMYSHANLRQPKFKTTIQPASKAVELETQLWQSYQLTHSQAKDVAEFIEQYCQEREAKYALSELCTAYTEVVGSELVETPTMTKSRFVSRFTKYLNKRGRELSLKSKKEEA